jgi:hypothetical protein
MSKSRPNIIDVRAKLPHTAQLATMFRALAHVFYIFVHYSADRLAASATEEQEIAHLVADANFHINKVWGTDSQGNPIYGYALMYTYAIFQSGRIYQCNDEDRLLWNTTNGNPYGLAVVHVLGDGEQPTAEMLASSTAMLDWLTSRYDIPAKAEHVFGHGECGEIYGGGPDFGNNTPCPGKMLDFTQLYRKGAVLPDPQPNNRFFKETGQYISNAFKGAWERLEQIPLDGSNMAMLHVGYPITPEMQETLGSWTGTTQYFERARMEYHTELGTPVVMWGLVGAELQAYKADAGHTCDCAAK